MEEKVIFKKGETYQFHIKTTKKNIPVLAETCKILEKLFDTKLQGNGLHLGDIWSKLSDKAAGKNNKGTRLVDDIYIVISIDPDSINDASIYIDITDEFYNEEGGTIIDMLDIFNGRFEIGEQ